MLQGSANCYNEFLTYMYDIVAIKTYHWLPTFSNVILDEMFLMFS